MAVCCVSSLGTEIFLRELTLSSTPSSNPKTSSAVNVTAKTTLELNIANWLQVEDLRQDES